MIWLPPISSFFFFNDTATTEIYTLSLHDALPISDYQKAQQLIVEDASRVFLTYTVVYQASNKSVKNYFLDRKSTRLNSSHSQISYAVFCLKKKKKNKKKQII